MRTFLVFILGAALLTACNNTDKPASASAPEEIKPLAVSKNSDSFNTSFDKMLIAYLMVKDALVDYDTAKANTASLALSVLADSLNLDAIKGDTSGTIVAAAKTSAGVIAGSAKGLAGETDLLKKKREFQMISDALYDMIRIVKYDGKKIFHQFCPMAFNDNEGANWISVSNEIVNPYLGKKHPKYKDGMLHCGEVTDSLDFRK